MITENLTENECWK